jgi:hypothetical protein
MDMIRRLVALAGGAAGAVALSQFPEFSQQYLQRLAGQVDALTEVAAEFDASTAKAGFDREGALLALGAEGFSGQHAADLRATFARTESLRADLQMLRFSGVIERLVLPHRFADVELLQDTWADFAPAVPVTTAGLACAGVGFAGGWASLALMIGLLSRLFRRRVGPVP